MKTTKWMMLLACAVIGAGLYAEDQKPERPGKGRRWHGGQRMDMSAFLGLNEAEQKAAAEAENALKEALAFGKGYIIDCAIEMDEMVRPMVPVGGRITQFLIDS